LTFASPAPQSLISTRELTDSEETDNLQYPAPRAERDISRARNTRRVDHKRKNIVPLLGNVSRKFCLGVLSQEIMPLPVQRSIAHTATLLVSLFSRSTFFQWPATYRLTNIKISIPLSRNGTQGAQSKTL